MAPSANRRSGYSRRAQYTTFFGYMAGVAGVLFGLGLLVASLSAPGTFSGLRGLVSDVAEPGGRATAAGRSASTGLMHSISGYFRAGTQNAKLQRELAAAKARLTEADAIEQENRRLKAMLGLAQGDLRPVAITTLTSSSATSTRRFATIGAGRAQGVEIGMPVRSPLGLIGRVLEVGRGTSRVLLLTDGESVVPARRSTDDVVAFAQGRSDGSVQLKLVNLGINPIRNGDVFVTSGSGGMFRPGIPIARVTGLTRDGAIARLLSDPAATDFVSVEPLWISPPPPALPGSPAISPSQTGNGGTP